jgi:phospholipid/cholesterol/gamma-HCH transport system ATP-binding protein
MEQAQVAAGHHSGGAGYDMRVVVPQLEPTPGLPPRQAVQRRKDRVMSILPTLPPAAQEAIIASLSQSDLQRYRIQRPSHGRPVTPQPAPPQAPPPPGAGSTMRPGAQTRPMQPAPPRPAPTGRGPGPESNPVPGFGPPRTERGRYELPHPQTPTEPGGGGSG